ncbi:hypothetical protein D3875_07865 [Deinococcus cavernae]|uniref:Uncharacterized protein n=2 Tax=Deinococcus cavernae TaxID=2320857 RepID=A0A418V5W3_9DEIO|nr:hypothetical protein D3875_07865 [Deinococcus cavernae]
MNTIYRIARRGQEPQRADFPTLALVLDGLTKILGKPVSLLDVLEYVPGTPPLAPGGNSSAKDSDNEPPGGGG